MTNNSDQGANLEDLSVPAKRQVRLAEQKKRLALTRYKQQVRKGAAWFKHSASPGGIKVVDGGDGNPLGH